MMKNWIIDGWLDEDQINQGLMMKDWIIDGWLDEGWMRKVGWKNVGQINKCLLNEDWMIRNCMMFGLGIKELELE